MPVASKGWEHGENAYKELSMCVFDAINNDEPDVATICAYGLLHLAQAEKGSYWGYKGAYNYNTAMETVETALRFIKEKGGVGMWLEKMYKEMLEEYEKETGMKIR